MTDVPRRLVFRRMYYAVGDVDVAEASIRFGAQFDGVAMTADNAILYNDVLAQAWRG